MNPTNEEQAIIDLSAKKWQWMADREVAPLTDLFHSGAVFVHMGGAWGTDRELAIIESGDIHYKHADVHEVSATVVGETAVVLTKLTLLAVVGGQEVSNLFEVTEAYARTDDRWTLLALAFTKLLVPAEPAARR